MHAYNAPADKRIDIQQMSGNAQELENIRRTISSHESLQNQTNNVDKGTTGDVVARANQPTNRNSPRY